MHQYRLTWVGVALSLGLWAVISRFDLDLFERFVAMIYRLERWEADELFFPALVLLGFAYADATRRLRTRLVDAQKHVVYEAMLSASYHVLRNFLNQMQLFKMTAENSPNFPKDVISLYDSVMGEAVRQLDALSAIDSIDPRTIRESVEPKR